MTYKLVWNNELIDSFDTLSEARAMATEYAIAFRGHVSVVKGKAQ